MANISIDFSNVKSGFEPIPEGTYNAVVVEVEPRTSQAGKPYLNWKLRLQGGEYDGRTVFYTTSLQPQSLWNLKDALIALGFPKEQLNSPEFQLDTNDLLQLECCVVIKHETYNGELRDRVQRLLPATAGGGSSLAGGADLYR